MTVNLHSLMIQGNLVTLNRLKLDPSDILSIQFGQKVVDVGRDLLLDKCRRSCGST